MNSDMTYQNYLDLMESNLSILRKLYAKELEKKDQEIAELKERLDHYDHLLNFAANTGAIR